MALQDDLLRHALGSRLSHLQLGHRFFPPGGSTPLETSPVHRMHLILAGQLEYVVEDGPCVLSAGDQSLSLAWTPRRWSVVGEQTCEIVFVGFTTVQTFEPVTGLLARHLPAEDFATELQMFQRLLARHVDYIEQCDELWGEAEIKGSLGRFLRGPFFCSPADDGRRSTDVHPVVRQAQDFLMGNFADARALRRLHEVIRVTPNYLRRLFQSNVRESPGDFLQRVRMQRARELLQRTPLSVKEVAASVGFNDPLHFSRRYARFWNHPPSRDRQAHLSV